jgi:transcriptional regulator with XRE-family HTH domain
MSIGVGVFICSIGSLRPLNRIKAKFPRFLIAKNDMKNKDSRTRHINEREKTIKNIQQRIETLDIGNEIRTVLHNSGFSEQYLADFIRCDRSNISKIFKRKNNLNVTQLILISAALQHNFFDKICDLLKTEPEDILSDICTIDITPNSVQIIRRKEGSVIIFNKQKE